LFPNPYEIIIASEAKKKGGMAEYWEITTAKVEVNIATFFKTLAKYFPDATTLVVDEIPNILEVKKIYQAEGIKGDDIPERWKSFFSHDHLFRFSSSLIEEFAKLYLDYSPVLLFNIISLYKDDTLLFEWRHALWGENPMFVTADMPEGTLLVFAVELGLSEWQRVDFFEQQTWMDKVVQVFSGLGCLVIVLLFFWLIVTRGCSQ
jgi:hypothetical protein